MDEFTIGFEDNAVWRELTFRGVSEAVAKAMATGLSEAGFSLVTLTGSQPTVIALTEEPSTGSTVGLTGATGSGSTGATGSTGSTGLTGGFTGSTGAVGS